MQDLVAVKLSFLIPLLPLIGAIIAGFFGARFLKQNSHWPIWIGVGASALLSFLILLAVWNHSDLDKHDGHDLASTAPRDFGDYPAISKHWFNWILAGGDS